MKILRATPAAVVKAAGIVMEGGVVVYPTDTLYGLGCNPLNEESVRRVFRIKGRRTKPLPILASGIEEIRKIAHMAPRALRIAEKFWPGPLTIVLPKKSSLPNTVTLDMSSVAVRVPNHTVALDLIKQAGGLLTGTSANKTGKKPPRTALEAAEQIGREVDLIMDDGPAPIGASSTIVDLTYEELKILRQGPIVLEDILAA